MPGFSWFQRDLTIIDDAGNKASTFIVSQKKSAPGLGADSCIFITLGYDYVIPFFYVWIVNPKDCGIFLFLFLSTHTICTISLDCAC